MKELSGSLNFEECFSERTNDIYVLWIPIMRSEAMSAYIIFT